MRNIIYGVLVAILVFFTFKYFNTKKADEAELWANSMLIQEQSKNVGKLVVTEGHFSEVFSYKDSKDGHYPVRLKNAIRVYSWTGANSLSQLATEGSTLKTSRLSVKVPSIGLNAIEIIEMTDCAVENLATIKTWRAD